MIKKRFKDYTIFLIIAIFVSLLFYYTQAIESPKHNPSYNPTKLDEIFLNIGLFLPFLIVFLYMFYNELKNHKEDKINGI
jgi:hypothetical protein